MQELLLLLLPVAAASGWLAARRSARKPEREYDEGSNSVYFRGLNHLLNEEPDKAIDVFVEMLEVDSETVETHLALGNLFRRRGEVDRAIRIHQNLIARPALTREQRAQALLELGQDYMRAGLYDRAENLFHELKEMRLHVKSALKNLRTIYQQEKDWEACLEVAEQLGGMGTVSLDQEKSQYYCELALQAKGQGNISGAKTWLKKALSVHRDCVRANHIQAKFEAEQGDHRTAIRMLNQTIAQDADYLPEVLGELVENYKAIGDYAGLRRTLVELSKRFPYSGADLYLVDFIREHEGEREAVDFLSRYLAETPNLPALMRMIELNVHLPEARMVEVMGSLREHLQRLLDERSAYQCRKCGFHAKTLHWQCPSCQSWSTIKRRPLVEAES